MSTASGPKSNEMFFDVYVWKSVSCAKSYPALMYRYRKCCTYKISPDYELLSVDEERSVKMKCNGQTAVFVGHNHDMIFHPQSNFGLFDTWNVIMIIITAIICTAPVLKNSKGFAERMMRGEGVGQYNDICTGRKPLWLIWWLMCQDGRFLSLVQSKGHVGSPASSDGCRFPRA